MFSNEEYHRAFERREKSLLRNLEETRNKLELSKRDWAESYLRIDEEDYEQILARKQSLSATSLFHVTEKLWINPSDLESGTIDFEALKRVHEGEKDFIHPRYTVAAKSRKHTVLNCLNFVARSRGNHLKVSVNRHFQISDDFWTRGLMGPINIRFVSDLMVFLRERNFTDREFKAMGMNSCLTLKQTAIGRRLSSSKNIHDLYDRLVYDLIHQIEDNCVYRITQMTENECIIESVSNPAIADALEVSDVGNADVCQYRAGVFMSLPRYLGSRPASVVETHCVHRGDPNCRFVVDFSVHRIRDNGVRLTPVL